VLSSLERWKPIQKLETKNAKAPNVHTSVMFFAFHCGDVRRKDYFLLILIIFAVPKP
jgi:hypothetical protein